VAADAVVAAAADATRNQETWKVRKNPPGFFVTCRNFQIAVKSFTL